MNSLLFDRASGSLPATAFARTQSARLVHTIQPAPKARFNGGEKEVLSDDDNDNDALATASTTGTKIWAHQSGVNALGIDIEKKM
jgi:DNA excision repair protein ERCC-8